MTSVGFERVGFVCAARLHFCVFVRVCPNACLSCLQSSVPTMLVL